MEVQKKREQKEEKFKELIETKKSKKLKSLEDQNRVEVLAGIDTFEKTLKKKQ